MQQTSRMWGHETQKSQREDSKRSPLNSQIYQDILIKDKLLNLCAFNKKLLYILFVIYHFIADQPI